MICLTENQFRHEIQREVEKRIVKIQAAAVLRRKLSHMLWSFFDCNELKSGLSDTLATMQSQNVPPGVPDACGIKAYYLAGLDVNIVKSMTERLQFVYKSI